MYHVNSKGVVEKCNAQSGNCPFKTKHFESAELANEYITNKNLEKDLYKNKPKSERIFKYAQSKEFLNVGNYNHLLNLEEKYTFLEKKFLKRYNGKPRPVKMKALEDWEKTNADYQFAKQQYNNYYKVLQKHIGEREQAHKFIKENINHIEDFSFSKASSSTYIVLKPNASDTVYKNIEKTFPDVILNPNINKDKSVLIRLSNHLPKQVLKANETDPNKYFEHTDTDVLVMFNQVETNKRLKTHEFKHLLNKYGQVSDHLHKERINIL